MMVDFAAPDPPLVHWGVHGRMAGLGLVSPEDAATAVEAAVIEVGVAEMKCMGTKAGEEFFFRCGQK